MDSDQQNTNDDHPNRVVDDDQVAEGGEVANGDTDETRDSPKIQNSPPESSVKQQPETTADDTNNDDSRHHPLKVEDEAAPRSGNPDGRETPDTKKEGPPPEKKKDKEEKKDSAKAEGDEGSEKVELPPRPQHWPIDSEDIYEMFERRSMEKYQDMGSLEGIAGKIETSIQDGFNSDTIEKRLEQWGENVLDKKEPVTFFEMLVEAYSDKIIQLLLAAAILSIIFGLTLPNPHSGHVERETGWIEGVAIIISVLVVTMTGSINNYQKAKKFEELEAETAVKNCAVIRDGKEVATTTDLLVVGDIMILETGIEVPCDGLLVQGNDLRTNESAITGEPDLIHKTLEKNVFLVSGTAIEEGNGRMMVIAVGMLSVRGRLKKAVSEESGETPLQEHLTELADDIGKIGLIGAILLLAALSLKEVILITTKDKEASVVTFLGFIIIAITIIAVAIPEGLPLAVTISLAWSMKAMMEEQCMVRVLASCETMGAATAVCSDKTGTLTTNQMTTVQGVLCEEEFMIEGYGLSQRSQDVTSLPKEDTNHFKSLHENRDKLFFAIAVNSTARQQTNDEGKVVWAGNNTEAGMLTLPARCGYDYAATRAKVADRMHQFPFSSKKKRMSTLVREEDGSITMYSKGASETILEHCQTYVEADGAVSNLDDMKRSTFLGQITDMAKQGNRTIGVAYCTVPGTEFPEDEPEDAALTFIGVLGIQDPMRTEVPAAVEQCKKAGVTVRMVTGDNIDTAKAIGEKCGLYKPDNSYDLAMTGPDFRKMAKENKEELLTMLPRLRVLARSSPDDKHILVGLLQDELGEVVGVTGDGTNDAPALKLADVGFAMATGTDIARGAADMVLLDDNFATVVTAIRWGRAVNDNIKKFLQYQLAINLAGCSLTVVGALISENSKEPLAAVQLLWLNLIMDTLAALSLATERPEDASLDRDPVFKQAPLITNKMIAFIGIHGFYQFILVLLILLFGHDWFNTIDQRPQGCDNWLPLTRVDSVFNTTSNTSQLVVSESHERRWCRFKCEQVGGVPQESYGRYRCQQGEIHSTLIFNIFIWFQVFNVINARKIYGELNPFEGLIDRSKMLLGVFVIIIVLQVLVVEFADRFMKTTHLTWDYWLISIGFGLSELIVGFFVRVLPIKDKVPDLALEKAAREIERRRNADEAARLASEQHADGGEVSMESSQRRHSTTAVRSSDPSLRRSQSIMKRR